MTDSAITPDKLAQPEVMRIDREAFDHALKEGREELIDLIRSVVREELAAQVTAKNFEMTSEEGILERMQEAMREAIIDATRPALVDALQRLAPDIRRAVGRDTTGQLEYASAWHESHDSAERALNASPSLSPCSLPQPAGWYCTRHDRHDGPCAREACTTPARQYEDQK